MSVQLREYVSSAPGNMSVQQGYVSSAPGNMSVTAAGNMSVQLQGICQHIVQANWSDRPDRTFGMGSW